jgi:hypothetical protein
MVDKSRNSGSLHYASPSRRSGRDDTFFASPRGPTERASFLFEDRTVGFIRVDGPHQLSDFGVFFGT